MSGLTDFYIKQLEVDKADLEKKIAELQREVATINNLIYRRKSQSFAGSRDEKVNRKNVDRIFYESVIVDVIKASNDGLRTSQVHTNAENMGYKINYNTLRSYIADMRDKGIIKKRTPTSHYWIVV